MRVVVDLVREWKTNGDRRVNRVVAILLPGSAAVSEDRRHRECLRDRHLVPMQVLDRWKWVMLRRSMTNDKIRFKQKQDFSSSFFFLI